jgi:magnesium-transporting ATPase (P-type)
MIERIQTVFLFLVVILMTTFIFLPIWQKENPKTKEKVVLNAFSMHYEKIDNNQKSQKTTTTIYLGILAFASAGLALYSIFQYKNRIFQMKMVLLNTGLMFILSVLNILLGMQGDKLIAETKNSGFQAGFLLIPIALLFNFLARKAIKRDEDLVRSADRIR